MPFIEYRPHENCREVAAFVGETWSQDMCDEAEDDVPYYFYVGDKRLTVHPGQVVWKNGKGDMWVAASP